jgi:hypothetical protein
MRTERAVAFHHWQAWLLGAMLAGCAPVGAGLEAPPPATSTGVPGFDTRAYPGASVMAAWRAESPYRWVGYYLESPCHPRSSWTGRRAELAAGGWGMAVLYVGEQDWNEVPSPPAGPGVTPQDAPQCTRENLTEDHGRAHGAAASALATAEGFAAGTIVYLNVERVERVTPALRAYVSGWLDGMLDAGVHRPGLYVHAHNANALYALAVEAFGRRGRQDRPGKWVALAAGFDLTRRPSDSGFRDADIWQGVFNVRETWGGTSLLIDVNVAASTSPSTPPAR